ncbi:MAG: hypothetical protein JXB85_08145, partial [Anaerolineales bacterium]|nr:hypothetical protein [Anaerolineales bacterium]
RAKCSLTEAIISRILRRALSKGKAYEGKNRHFEAKRGRLSQFSVIFQGKTAVLWHFVSIFKAWIQTQFFTQWVKGI